MIILTGAAGFIGANTLIALNKAGITNILIVDNIQTTIKWRYLIGRDFYDYIHKDRLWTWLENNKQIKIEGVIHLGACSDTTERNYDYFALNNVHYSQRLWHFCTVHQIPFVYASSAATYGRGENGFSDAHDKLFMLKPINAYGFSKHRFDLWALQQNDVPPCWAGLKYFNVYGPYEDHKGKMASVVYHAYAQVLDRGIIRLFESHQPAYRHGEQLRDFIYVEDAVAVTLFFLQQSAPNGLYNVGTGIARTFNDLASAIFAACNKLPVIEYFSMPEELRNGYQYYTQADVTKLRAAGYEEPFTPLENGVQRYVEFLAKADEWVDQRNSVEARRKL